ncbi:MAG TPA: [protein-PII] uridylyltransferase [Bacteroidota bacterium]|nr:[protein-PII] uridylyltransferase [Bacteroidota bacterium]
MRSSEGPNERFQREFNGIVQAHHDGAGGIRTALALSRRLDRLVTSVYRAQKSSKAALLSIVALGGYGRRELCFFSDVDVMFLAGSDVDKQRATGSTERILRSLIDLGLDVGHSFRTIDECMEFSDGELETWLSLLESRYLCGNRTTFRTFTSRIAARIQASDRAAFVDRIGSLTATRHEKYGDSTTLLEPNIKNSAGGLRDLHTSLWIVRGLGRNRPASSSDLPAIAQFLRSAQHRKLLGNEIARMSLSAFDFLLRTRNEMHVKSQSHHDTLEFSFQPAVASGLHYRSAASRTNVERFMQDYYIAARTAAQVARRCLVWAQDVTAPRINRRRPENLDEHFTIVDRKLDLRHRNVPLTNALVLRAFVLSNEHRIDFSFPLQDRIHHLRRSLTPLRSRQETDLFRRLLNQPEGLGRCLHAMNDLGILERWIPEWKPMVAFFQHNMYHYYTADEHTLKVVDTAESLSKASSLSGEVFRSLTRRDTLYLACLFHDIAKPRRIGDHEIVGVDIARTILQRLRYTDTAREVSFLVRHHLMMEQVAFRRNLSDPQTILDFASRFENVEQLKLLFILTYADLSAVNKHVWTQWKEMLLTDLYRKTFDVLTEQKTTAQMEAAAARERERQLSLLLPSLGPSVSQEEAKAHLGNVESPEYLTSFEAAEISEHIRAIASGEQATALFRHQAEFTEVTFIAPDAPFALSHCCAVLTANDANIFDAHIFTRTDGIIIDKFRVASLISSSSLSDQQCTRIRSDFREVFLAGMDVKRLLERHQLKWKRRMHAINPNIRFDVEFESHPRFTIIDVYAADKIGFLHRVTETMSTLGLNISFAKIATRVDGIVDSFYVLDRFGQKVGEGQQQEFVRNEIMETMRKFFELELAETERA